MQTSLNYRIQFICLHPSEEKMKRVFMLVGLDSKKFWEYWNNQMNSNFMIHISGFKTRPEKQVKARGASKKAQPSMAVCAPFEYFFDGLYGKSEVGGGGELAGIMLKFPTYRLALPSIVE